MRVMGSYKGERLRARIGHGTGGGQTVKKIGISVFDPLPYDYSLDGCERYLTGETGFSKNIHEMNVLPLVTKLHSGDATSETLPTYWLLESDMRFYDVNTRGDLAKIENAREFVNDVSVREDVDKFRETVVKRLGFRFARRGKQVS